MSEPMFIAIVGNPVDGFAYCGPFETSEAAVEFGSDDGRKECWAAALINPSEEDSEAETTPTQVLADRTDREADGRAWRAKDDTGRERVR